MRPLVFVAAGLILVAVDVRTQTLDILLDPVGWLLVAEGARRLAVPAAAAAAVVTAVLSLSEAFLPSHFVSINALTGKVDPGGTGPEHLAFDAVTGWRLAALVLTVVAGAATLWLLLRRFEQRARVATPTAVNPLRLAQWLVIVVWALPYVAVALVDHDGFDPVWNDGRELLALAGIAVLVGLAVGFTRSAGRRWAVPPKPVTSGY